MLKKLSLILTLSLIFCMSQAAFPDVVHAAAGNTQYSLAGAKYQLYTNAACTAAAKDANGNNAVLTTGADGRANTLKMKPGTYYAKEVTASKGYKLDTKIYTLVVTASNTAAAPAMFTSPEPPLFGIPEFMVFKEDATGTSDYTGLTGAAFTVKYYDVADKAAIAGASPKDQWTFETIKKDAPGDAPEGTYCAGFDWQTDEPVSSSRPDSKLFYRDSNGKRVLPLGWFTIEETAAPKGFRLTDKICYGHIYRDSSGNVVTELEDAKADSGLQTQVVIFEDEPELRIATSASLQNGNSEVVDVISYEGLIPDSDYVFRGWLVDTATGEKVPGSDGSVKLLPCTASSGQVEMTMKTSGYDGMPGHSMTAFEELYIVKEEGGENTEVHLADHKDINDKSQTVEIYQDLKVQKNVTGNLGDLTKEFEYTAEFIGLVPGQPYTVEGYDGKVFIADPSGKAEIPLKLMDDKSVTIKQLPKGARYRITEKASDHVAGFRLFSEDMADKGAKIIQASGSNDEDAAKELTTALETVDLMDGTVVVAWENNRDLATLTAVPSYLGIWACAAALLLAGLVMLLIKRKKYREE
ncbi:MAG: VaFE repeat-containing surface-anchored protein [Mogibacterium sp.]|nr:VaFE repeat-containing surface-anchored protein [Mogibacterium sp.]